MSAFSASHYVYRVRIGVGEKLTVFRPGNFGEQHHVTVACESRDPVIHNKI